MKQAVERIACRRCGRETELNRYAFCSVCTDWWEELVGIAATEGIEWDPENTKQVGLDTYE